MLRGNKVRFFCQDARDAAPGFHEVRVYVAYAPLLQSRVYKKRLAVLAISLVSHVQHPDCFDQFHLPGDMLFSDIFIVDSCADDQFFKVPGFVRGFIPVPVDAPVFVPGVVPGFCLCARTICVVEICEVKATILLSRQLW